MLTEALLVAAAKSTKSPAIRLEFAKYYLNVHEWGRAIQLLDTMVGVGNIPQQEEINLTLSSAYQKIGFHGGPG